MKKILLQFSVLVFTFFGLFFLFQQINWMKLFKVNETKVTLEQKLGDQLWKFYSEGQDEIIEKKVSNAVHKIFEKICDENKIKKENIKLKIVDNEEVNAFAFPNNYLVVHSALLLEAKNEEELAGVLAHEIAHIENKHVMKKLINDIGFAVLISMVDGTGGGKFAQALKNITSSAYSRDLEEEADLKAVDYLLEAKINPAPFADFLYRLADNDLPAYMNWLSTHPESSERAEVIINKIPKTKIEYQKILTTSIWETMKNNLE